MKPRKRETFQPVTLGHIRGHGCRDLLVYCASIQCNHRTKLCADHLPDETPIRALGTRMVCTRCGHRGADVRPDWSPHMAPLRPGMGPGLGFGRGLTYISAMLRPKKSAPQTQSLPTWSIVRIKSTPAHPVGQVQAPDAESAVRAAIEKYDIPAQYHDRLLARRVR
jgi:hypothetical protein